jgi:hypothetical protein
MNKLFLLVMIFVLFSCKKASDTPEPVQPDVLTYLTKTDSEAIILIALKNDVDTTKVNTLVQSYLDHFNMLNLISNNHDPLQALHPNGQFKVIDSLSIALAIPKQVSASILYDYILLTKKCDCDVSSSDESNSEY